MGAGTREADRLAKKFDKIVDLKLECERLKKEGMGLVAAVKDVKRQLADEWKRPNGDRLSGIILLWHDHLGDALKAIGEE